MKALIAALALCGAAAQAGDWISIADMNDSSFEMRIGTAQITKNRQGMPVSTFLGRFRNKTNGSVTFVQWYVTQQDCRRGRGSLWAADISTGDVKSRSDFVRGGGNVASNMAELACILFEDK